MKTFWTTFYSYKGGVGRSMALSNIAALLVQKGRSVVLIDFDLEAPGLDSFTEFSQTKGKQGVVEYVCEFQRNKIAPDITKFVHECQLPGPLPGKLWVMPAGKKDASYNRQRTELNWLELYESGLGEPFIENWKAAISEEFQPDYVLVDSRTGLTDVGGICTLQFPDLVVMLFGLNDQNIHGISAVGKTILEADHNRIPQIHYVASPVPNLPLEKRGLMIERFEAATKELGVELESVIHYNSLVALHEELYVLHDAEVKPRSLIRDYEQLLKKIINFNRNGLDFIATQVDEMLKSRETARAEKLYSILEREFQGSAEAVFLMSRLRLVSGDRNEAVGLAEEALRLDPSHVNSYEWLNVHFNSVKEYQKALKTCDWVLAHSEIIPKTRLPEIHNQRGCAALACGDAKASIISFEFFAVEEQKKSTPALLMVALFNLAEAKRRSGEVLTADKWKEIVNLYEQSGETSKSELPFQANRLQAIHIAYALSGDIPRARGVLRKAKQAADLLGEIEDLFTVKTYENVSQPEFLKITDEMLEALEKGMLWDGLQIPTAL
jgi:MinD-like ATPase involved in chromosome partitioning or flagellar assembly